MPFKKPFIVIVPGASQNPSNYGYLSHLLQLAGYPTFSALLPSVGAAGKVTVDDDAAYVRDKMLLPVLDHEEHDVIVLFHSYSGLPGSAAAAGLGKAERAAQGKKTGIIGQVFIASILAKGGDGVDLKTAFGGQFPPHIRPDPEANLLRCDERVSPLLTSSKGINATGSKLADVAAASMMAQGLTSFTSPCPRASWDSDDFKGRVAFIRTTEDNAIPLPVQQMMIDGTGVDWILEDLESDHSPQYSMPDKLTSVLVKLAERFENI